MNVPFDLGPGRLPAPRALPDTTLCPTPPPVKLASSPRWLNSPKLRSPVGQTMPAVGPCMMHYRDDRPTALHRQLPPCSGYSLASVCPRCQLAQVLPKRMPRRGGALAVAHAGIRVACRWLDAGAGGRAALPCLDSHNDGRQCQRGGPAAGDQDLRPAERKTQPGERLRPQDSSLRKGTAVWARTRTQVHGQAFDSA
jgi:hypothetical protein